MKTIHLIIFFFALLVTSCCTVYDSKVPDGYPFTQEVQQLNYQAYSEGKITDENLPYYIHFHPMADPLIRDSAAFRNYFGGLDNTVIPAIDFSRFDLTYVSGKILDGYEVSFQIRPVIDHKQKTYTIEMRGHLDQCGVIYDHIYLNKLVLVPKVPPGYAFQLKRLYPVTDLP